MKRLIVLAALAALLTCLWVGACAEELVLGPQETEAAQATEPETQETTAQEVVIAEEETTAEEEIAEEEAEGCGEGLSWFVSGNTLTISGTGEMYDFKDGTPWKSFGDTITRVIIEDGVGSVGDYAFEDMDRLTDVQFGKDVMRLGKRSFASCDSLTSISLPKAFRTFEEECLYSCKGLKEIHCEGSFPHFRLNCLWETECKIYFPAERPWSVIYIEELEDAFKGRIEFLASDGTDPYTPTEATEETTEPATEATTEPTEATTAPTMVPVTAPTTAPTTVPTTEPETTAPVYTRDPTAETLFFGNAETTRPPETTQPSSGHSGSGIGFAIVIFVLASVGIGMVIFRMTVRRRYDD